MSTKTIRKGAVPNREKLVADFLNLNSAMEREDVTQSRKAAKGLAILRTHPLGAWMLSTKFHCFAPLRLCVTSHSRF